MIHPHEHILLELAGSGMVNVYKAVLIETKPASELGALVSSGGRVVTPSPQPSHYPYTNQPKPASPASGVDLTSIVSSEFDLGPDVFFPGTELRISDPRIVGFFFPGEWTKKSVEGVFAKIWGNEKPKSIPLKQRERFRIGNPKNYKVYRHPTNSPAQFESKLAGWVTVPVTPEFQFLAILAKRKSPKSLRGLEPDKIPGFQSGNPKG